MKEIDWRNLGSLPESVQHTAKAVLRAAVVPDSDNAEQVLSNLTKLHLGGNQIVDISPLKSLVGLKTLYLSGNQIVDISPLKSLPLLEGVWIHGCFLPRKYFSSSQELDPRWLLEERNTAVRRALLLLIGYERI